MHVKRWDHSLLYRADYLNDTITEGLAAARYYLGSYWPLYLELWLIVGFMFGWPALWDRSYRHQTRHGGVGARRWFQAPYVIRGDRKEVYRRRVNHYSVSMVLNQARSDRGEDLDGVEQPIGIAGPEVRSIIHPREGVSDSGFTPAEVDKPHRVYNDLSDTGERLRTWDQYLRDVSAIGTSEIKEREWAA